MGSTPKLIKLKSSDGVIYEVEEAVALQSQTIKEMIEAKEEVVILLPNVKSKILSKVLEYCAKHVDADANDDELKDWDADFISVDDQGTFFDLMLAANYLNVISLLDFTCQIVADTMNGREPEEIRKMFNIKKDYTLEEEEDVMSENPWVFECGSKLSTV